MPDAWKQPGVPRQPWAPQPYSQSAHIRRLREPEAQPQARAWPQPAVAPRPARAWQPPAPAPYPPPVRKRGLTAAETFWYVLMCVGMGAGYFAKIPVKRALADAGLARMTGAERVWYVLMCVPFGAGYFAKVPVAKALSEMQR